VPEVSGSGVVPQTDVGLVITVSATEIAVDGVPIDGDVEKLAAYPMKDTEALVAIDRSLSYHFIYKVLAAAAKAGIRRFDLAAMQHGNAVMVPIAIPERKPHGFAVNKPNDPDLPIQLIVSIARDRMTLWSLSGLEGTLQAPKLSVARSDYAALHQALAEIAARRFAGGTRDNLDRTIIVMLDGELTAQDLLATAATVAEPFPDVLLAAGIE
jgi:hypothetical protein